MLAVLAAPYGAGADEAVAHTARVRAALDDERTRSFGALYHPWTVSVDGPIPPDGAAAGVLAMTAATRGCWTAPANIPLASVVALEPAIGSRAHPLLRDGHVNAVRREPRGFLCMEAGTLSADPDLGRLTVRRLLSLLRRSAQRDGPTYAFEPNDSRLRRSVRRRFEEILGGLLARGAFAGATPAESYEVVVGGGQARAGEALLVVELKVAPSASVRRMVVRLVNAGDSVLVTEGR
jgi:phage tail sheath protein FI